MWGVTEDTEDTKKPDIFRPSPYFHKWRVITILLFIFTLHLEAPIEMCYVIVKDGMILRNDVLIATQTIKLTKRPMGNEWEWENKTSFGNRSIKRKIALIFWRY